MKTMKVGQQWGDYDLATARPYARERGGLPLSLHPPTHPIDRDMEAKSVLSLLGSLQENAGAIKGYKAGDERTRKDCNIFSSGLALI